MNDLIIGKVSTALKGHWANPDLVSRPPSPYLPPSHFSFVAVASPQRRLAVMTRAGEGGWGGTSAGLTSQEDLSESASGSESRNGQQAMLRVSVSFCLSDGPPDHTG